MRVTLIFILAAAGALSACTGDGTGEIAGTAPPADAATARSTARPAATSRPAATATPDTDFMVGETVETTTGFRFSVFAYEAPLVSDNQFLTPDAGNQWAAVDVQECAGTSDDTYSANPFPFQLQMTDNTRRDADLGIREPSLSSTSLGLGDCVRGWVTFQVPIGERPAFVVFSEILGDLIIKWRVP